MRPAVLFPLFEPLTALKGVGPRLSALLEKLAGERVVDMLWHLPGGIIDRRHSPSVADAAVGEIATLTLRIDAHERPPRRGRPWRILCGDDTGLITLVYFNARADWLQKTFPEGEIRVVSGRVEEFAGGRQIIHPDAVVSPDEAESVLRVEPVYPLGGGLTARTVGNAVAGALQRVPDLAEWLDAPLVAREGWADWRAAVLAAHAPEQMQDLEPATAARRRLAYDELLASQVALQLLRAQTRKQTGRAFPLSGDLRHRAIGALPFTLTDAQERALAEIDVDMAGPARMLRLLQGDVGSGKTVVALLAMLTALDAGTQAALMAPTEVLARQHYQTILSLTADLGVRVVMLTGRDRGQARQQLVADLARGDIHIVVGTHALFSGDVAFHDLGLVVIDEQHRFGVHQRMALSDKGRRPDVLVMTATPIPRTLLLASWGDLDSSRLDEKPPGRQPVDTRALPLDRLGEVAPALERKLETGAQVFWVCPLVEESAEVDAAAATERHAWLKGRFGDRVGLLHGRLAAREKAAVMKAFQDGVIDILVSTTVIEVGVDVPNASVMVIEHAERFGLAQLHQLRGRIGRGARASTCILLYQPPLGEVARARIDILRETEDGFLIAEEDLRLRGGGEILGTRQSGLPRFRLADLSQHQDLLAMAHRDAQLFLEKDPALETPRGEALRTLLYLFERDEAARLLRSG